MNKDRKDDIILKLNEQDIVPSERIGQHILIDEKILNIVAGQIDNGSNVLEVGSGPGNLTEIIASKANKVVGIEIDQRYQPFLEKVQQSHPNVEIIYRNVMDVNFRKIIKNDSKHREWQLASNLPFHISEPFLKKIIDAPFKDCTLLVGDQLARSLQIENPENIEFTKSSLLAQTFYDVSVLSEVPKNMFYPPPRTDAAIVLLYPKQNDKYDTNPSRVILRNLFLSEDNNSTVIKIIKESTYFGSNQSMSRTENNRAERRRSNQELRQMVRKMQYNQTEFYEKGGGKEVEKLKLPIEILNKPFSRFDNQDIRSLAIAMRNRYGKL
jgi:16S rRNA (adenine1518-N6/adenine1519-N6)-dimethyltransferase